MSILELAATYGQRPHTYNTKRQRQDALNEIEQLVFNLDKLYQMAHDPRVEKLMRQLTALKHKILSF